MSNALNRVTEHEGLKLLQHKVEIIDELETTFPSWLEQRFAAHWYPSFVHVLRIDPERLEHVDLDALWVKGTGEGLVSLY